MTVKLLFILVLIVFIVSCNMEQSERVLISSSDARVIATEKIRKYESLLKIKAGLLPALVMSEEDERFVFKVEDEKQNIWLVVSVMFSGETNLSFLSLDEKRRRSEQWLIEYKSNKSGSIKSLHR